MEYRRTKPHLTMIDVGVVARGGPARLTTYRRSIGEESRPLDASGVQAISASEPYPDVTPASLGLRRGAVLATPERQAGRTRPGTRDSALLHTPPTRAPGTIDPHVKKGVPLSERPPRNSSRRFL